MSSPEAAVGGPLALVKNGDRIRLSVSERKLELLVDEAELARRRAAHRPRALGAERGYAKLYIAQRAAGRGRLRFRLPQKSLSSKCSLAPLAGRGLG